MIALTGISKTYGGVQALAPLSLTLAAGQTTALIGPSGCGKSTLLRLIMGLAYPDEGEVVIDGTPLTDASVTHLRRRMGYVIQEGGLFPHLTAWDNVALMPRHLGWPAARLAERMEVLSALVQLPHERLQHYPTQLSGGQRQRVSLMRALVLGPDILLLDEPLGALDPMIRADLQRDLRDIFQSLQKTVIVVTHDLREAAYLADHVILLHHGEIAQQGTYASLVRRPASTFVEAFIRAQQGPGEAL